MPIPEFNEHGRLPEGEHLATLTEVQERFGYSSDRRRLLMERLLAAAKNMAEAGVPYIYINGSFVTDKEEPNDIDGCWRVVVEIDWEKLDPIFYEGSRQDVQDKYSLDFFQDHFIEAGSGEPFPKFFQTDRDGNPRGIILVDLTQEKGNA